MIRQFTQKFSVFETVFFMPHLDFHSQSIECRHDGPFKHALRVLAAPGVVLGTSFASSLQFVLLTPFLVTLGVSRTVASVIWLVGPLTGLVVQPLVGVLSDEYHKRHATRLPIVLISSSVLILSHIAVAFTKTIAEHLSLSPVFVLVISFWMFDAASNAITVTCRAMLSDRFAKSQRTRAFSVQQFWMSFGSIMGYLTAQIDWADDSNNPESLASSMFYCFVISSIVVSVGTLMSFVSVYEKRACRMRNHGPHTGESFELTTMCDNPTLVSILAGSALTWFGWFAQQIYQSDFISSELQAPGDDESLSGVQASAFGLLISSGLSCLFGLIIPLLLSYTGNEGYTLFRIWSVSCFLQGIVLIGSCLVTTIPGGIMWEAATGPMFAVACTIPYMLVANGCDHGSSGRVMAVVNVAVCFPQLIVSGLGGLVIESTRTNTAMFTAGGILCIIATRILWVPAGFEVPPWSEKSTASILASTSDIFSYQEFENVSSRRGASLVPEFRVRGLSSPRLREPLLLPLLPNTVDSQE